MEQEMDEMKVCCDYCWLLSHRSLLMHGTAALLRPVTDLINLYGGTEVLHLQKHENGEMPVAYNYTINHIMFMTVM